MKTSQQPMIFTNNMTFSAGNDDEDGCVPRTPTLLSGRSQHDGNQALVSPAPQLHQTGAVFNFFSHNQDNDHSVPGLLAKTKIFGYRGTVLLARKNSFRELSAAVRGSGALILETSPRPKKGIEPVFVTRQKILDTKIHRLQKSVWIF